jgi:hypothetical protein
VQLIPPSALLEQLEQRLPVLTNGYRDAPARQHTLRATLDWSYDLLPESEQALFRRLGVFRGGFTLDGAEAVGTIAPHLRPETVVQLVSTLVDANLVTVEAAVGQREARLGMLETVHEYAHQLLTDHGELECVQRAHASYYLNLTERAAPCWNGPEPGNWIRSLELEHDNLRAALDWSIEHADAAVGVRLSSELGRFWQTAGYASEGRTWLTAALDCARRAPLQVPPAKLAAAYRQALALAHVDADLEAANRLFTDVLAQSRALDDAAQSVFALVQLAAIQLQRGDIGGAADLFEEAEHLARETNDDRGLALALLNHGKMLGLDLGQSGLSETLLLESLRIARRLEDRVGMLYALLVIGGVKHESGDAKGARGPLHEVLRLASDSRYRVMQAYALDLVAATEAMEGAPLRAARLWGAANSIWRTLDLHRQPSEQVWYDDVVAKAMHCVEGPEAWAVAWNAGRALDSQLAVEEALGITAPAVLQRLAVCSGRIVLQLD